MNKKILLLAALSALGSYHAQSYLGFSHGNYAGVEAATYNPSSIVDSRFRTDINLFAFSAFVGNDLYGLNVKDLTKNSNKRFEDIASKNAGAFYNLATNIDILGPSFMFNINPKNSIAIISRFRAIGNVNDIDGQLLNGFTSNKSFELQNKQNFSSATNAWGELGLTYARVLSDKKEHFFKGGVTVKYLAGLLNAGAYANDFGLKYTRNEANPNLSTIQTTGTLRARDIKSDNFASLENLKLKGMGLGGDIGFTYEYRPEYQKYTYTDQNGEKQYYKDQNKYLLRLGLAVTDIGFIGYKDAIEDTYDANLTYSELDNNNKDFDQLYRITKRTKGDTFYLPTALHLNADYAISRSWFVNANADIALTSTKNNAARVENMFQLTPRFERRWFGAYLPISYLPLSGIQAGAGLRLGPIYVGSGSLFNALFSDNTKAVDVHFGVKIPILQSRITDVDKDGTPDKEDVCPNVPGPKENGGCPWKDSDFDGLLDKDDKCPEEAGPKENQGCPWPDTDNDGLLDKDDKCPKEAGDKQNQGCPWPDTDKDGVLDKDDKCPKEAGIKENQGCPKLEIPVAPVDVKILKKLNEYSKSVLFDNGKATIQEASHKDLDALAELIKQYPDTKFSIEGHTDNVGKEPKNQQLSADRANAIKNYLVSKGINEQSLSATGFGSKKPLVKNNTAKNKALNRRVEIKVLN